MIAAQNPEPKTSTTPTKPKFPRKTRLAKGVKNKAAAVDALPERDGGHSSIGQEPARPDSPALKALESGRTHRPNKATERLTGKPPRVEVTIPTRRKQANTAEAKLRKPRPGKQIHEKRNVTQSKCFPKTEGRHHRWNGEWPMERHDRNDSAYDQARKGIRVESKPT